MKVADAPSLTLPVFDEEQFRISLKLVCQLTHPRFYTSHALQVAVRVPLANIAKTKGLLGR